MNDLIINWDEVVDLYHKLGSTQRVANHLGVKDDVIRKGLKQMGANKPVGAHMHPASDYELRRIFRLWDSGKYTRKEIARMVGMSYKTICKYIRNPRRYRR